MVKVKSRPQTERVTKVIVVRKSVVRKGVPVRVRSGVQQNALVAQTVRAGFLYRSGSWFNSTLAYKIKRTRSSVGQQQLPSKQ